MRLADSSKRKKKYEKLKDKVKEKPFQDQRRA